MANKNIIIMTFIATILWFVTFAVDFGNFWLKIGISASALAISSLFLVPFPKDKYKISVKNIVIGIFSAAILYGIFYLGNMISGLLFNFSENQVGNIYAKGHGTHQVIIALILLFITSPAEEIFWRGYLQEGLIQKLGNLKGWIAATLIYGLVHIWSMNFMLIGAAMVAGAFWGLLYLKYRNIFILIISHAVWTFVIFVIWPIL